MAVRDPQVSAQVIPSVRSHFSSSVQPCAVKDVMDDFWWQRPQDDSSMKYENEVSGSHLSRCGLGSEHDSKANVSCHTSASSIGDDFILWPLALK